MMNKKESKKSWGVVSGTWGDVICQLGYVQKSGIKNILYYGGSHPVMYEFLKAQSFIETLEVAYCKDLKNFMATNRLLMRKSTFSEGMEIALEGHSLSANMFSPTSAIMDDNNADPSEIPIARNLKVPADCYAWADQIASQLNDDFYIIQPYSINSTTREAHWPHWHELIQWLAGDFSRDYVIAGSGWDAGLYKGFMHMRNMVDQFPTVCHLYALAERSKGVITTSNSLAHWCVSQHIPVTVIANIISSEPNYFFRKVLQGDHVHNFTYYASLQRISFALHERWGIWPSEA